MKVFKITGTDSRGKSLLNYVRAKNVNQAETLVGIRGEEKEGFDYVTWSTQEQEILPAEAQLECPHCGGSIDNPVLVVG